MLISRKQRFVFFATPKTGTRSFYKLLMSEFYGGERVGDHKHVLGEEFVDFYKFIVVREPYDRMLSLYLSCCLERGDVKGFVEDMSLVGLKNDFKSFLRWVVMNKKRFYSLNKSKYLILKSQAPFFENDFDKVIKFESVQESLKDLPFLDSDTQLPFLNRTYDENRSSYFDTEVYELINDYCHDEFQLTGYRKKFS
ncbi:hypothetical protein F9L16_06940 [Agarivorans sp. B2Z047]|uniref:sulfotransferase family 2 domain-containing protein n=1 Tax=Agarivorans sp. B2Z047 TaxID=2652721 RepID=UPI00128B7426|nr:sulfotransferase family 2 domain-containing protein [Agarivorans sp. B2Z047]MPW28739.1 hypothetical protein [Agarivorans sp. B2Z047]UQN41300.1 sulfotransferase family protein [Agarivorans sp. B2Z047]